MINKDHHELFHKWSSVCLSRGQGDPLTEPTLTCFPLAALPHNVWTMARSCMEEDEGTLDFCDVKHLEKLEVERIRLKIKAADL